MAYCSNGISRAGVSAKNGEPSALYQSLLKYCSNDKDAAVAIYVYAHSADFKSKFGDWETTPVEKRVDANGEPLIKEVIDVLRANYVKQVTDEFSSTTAKEADDFFDDGLKMFQDSTPQEGIANDSVDTFNDDLLGMFGGNSDTEVPLHQTINDFADDDIDDSTLKAKAKLNMLTPQQTDDLLRGGKYRSNIRMSIKRIESTLTALKYINNNDDLELVNRLTLSLNKMRTEEKIASSNSLMSIKTLETKALQMIKRAENLIKSQDVTLKDFVEVRDSLEAYVDISKYFLSPTEKLEGAFMQANPDEGTIGFSVIEARAKNCRSEMLDMSMEAMNDKINNNKIEGGMTYVYNIKHDVDTLKDSNIVWAHGFNIGRTDFKLLQYVEKDYHKHINSMNRRTDDINKQIDELSKDIKFDEFRESYVDGGNTGNIVHQYSPEYRDEYAMIRRKLRGIYKDQVSFSHKFGEWFKDNHIILDPRILFTNKVNVFDKDAIGLTDEEIDAAKDALILKVTELVGAEVCATMIKKVEDQIDLYMDRRDSKVLELTSLLNGNKISKDTYVLKLKTFDAHNSPYLLADNVITGRPTIAGDVSLFSNFEKDLTAIPRKYLLDKGGNDTKFETGWYNNQYDKLMSNPKNKAFYDFYIDLMEELNSIVPTHNGNTLDSNYVMFVKKTFIDIVKENGFKSTVVTDKLKEFYSKSDGAVGKINPVTGKITRELGVASIDAHMAAIKLKLDIRKEEFLAEYGIEPSAEDIQQFIRESKIELAQEASFDLASILKTHNYIANYYIQKAVIDDEVRAVDQIINSLKEPIIRKDGSTGFYKHEVDSFKNMKMQWNYWQDQFYGTHNKDSVTDKKVYTKSEQEIVDRLNKILEGYDSDYFNGKLDVLDYETKKDRINTLKQRLGTNQSYDQMGRTLLQITQFKGMGFNAISAVANDTFGYISNVIEANDGRIFNKKELMMGYKITAGNIVRFWSNRKISPNASETLTNIISRYDMLTKNSEELTFAKSFEKKNIIKDVYRFQNSSEYVNQAPLVAALLYRQKVTIIEDGVEREIPIFEAFAKDGNFRKDITIKNIEEWEGDDKFLGDKFSNLIYKIQNTINVVHGNYNRYMGVKMSETFWKASIKQFRTWMFETFAQRFEKEKYQESLGMIRKGRYRSGFMLAAYATPKDIAKENVTLMDHFNSSAFTILQTGRKLIYLDTKFDDRFEEADAANLRKNISEFIIKLKVMGVLLLLAAMKGAGDDDKKKKLRNLYLGNYLINTVSRVQSDISMYYNPTAFNSIIKQPIPFVKTILDAQVLGAACFNYILGDDEIHAGLYNHQSKLKRAAFKILPPLNRVTGLESMYKQEYTNNN